MAEAGRIEEPTTTLEKRTIYLEFSEAKELLHLLDRILGKSGKRYYSDELGQFTHLQRTDALRFNEVYKQLEGKDHNVYKRVYGTTMPKTNNPVRSNTINIEETQLLAISKLVDWERNLKNPKNHPSLIKSLIRPRGQLEKTETLFNLSRKLESYKPKPPLDITKIPVPPFREPTFSDGHTMEKSPSNERPKDFTMTSYPDGTKISQSKDS